MCLYSVVVVVVDVGLQLHVGSQPVSGVDTGGDACACQIVFAPD